MPAASSPGVGPPTRSQEKPEQCAFRCRNLQHGHIHDVDALLRNALGLLTNDQSELDPRSVNCEGLALTNCTPVAGGRGHSTGPSLCRCAFARCSWPPAWCTMSTRFCKMHVASCPGEREGACRSVRASCTPLRAGPPLLPAPCRARPQVRPVEPRCSIKSSLRRPARSSGAAAPRQPCPAAMCPHRRAAGP